MRRLLAANLRRLRLNKAFWLALIFMIGAELFYCAMLGRQGPIPRDVILFVSLQFISIVIAIFFSLFLGTEYSDGTIRNKLSVGHKRSHVYLASLYAGVVAVTLIYLVVILTGWLVGVFFFEAAHYSFEVILKSGLTGWLACLSFVSLYNLIGLLSASKAVTAIGCILTAFGSLFLSLFVFQKLSQPGALVSSEKEIYQWLFDVNPSGQLLQTMMIDINSHWRLMTYSLLLSLIVTVIGILLFRKKDLK